MASASSSFRQQLRPRHTARVRRGPRQDARVPLWHKDSDLFKGRGGDRHPGGFSYGDYLAPGPSRALASDESVKASRRRAAGCSASATVQILQEAGMLDGACCATVT